MQEKEESHISRLRAAGLLFLAASENILWGLLYSLQPPFYPQEAESKGATPSQYGFVFGIAYLAAFLASPLFAQYGHYVGPKWLFAVGAMVQAVVSVLFGLLDMVEDTTIFLVLSYLLRFVYGVMDAGAVAGVAAILMKLFPDKVAFLIACTETFFGLGYSVGPAVGGVLYAWGGFELPFVFLGLLGLVLSLAIFFVVPNLRSNDRFKPKTEISEGQQEISIWTVLKNPDVLSPLCVSATFFGGLGIVESLLSPYLTSAGATSLQVSLNFVLIGLCYMISALIVGHVVDGMRNPSLMTSLGSVLSFVAFLMIGPSPWLQPLVGEPTPTLILAMSALLGLSEGFVVTTTFVRCKVAMTQMGCQDDIRTYLRVSGLWFSSFYLGNSVGPLMGGFLVEWLGFDWTTASFAWLVFIVAAIDFVVAKPHVRRHYQRIPQ